MYLRQSKRCSLHLIDRVWARKNKVHSEGKGGRATRPPLQQHRFNVGESPSFAATQGQCGRLALLCSNTGSMWASRPPLQQLRVNVGDSPSFAATQMQCGRVALLCSNSGSMWATRPPLQQHRCNVGDSPSFAATQMQCGRVAHTPIAAMAPTSPPEQQSLMAIPYASESSRILYSTESTSARHVASMMLSLAPTVPQVASPSVDSISTRVIASLPCSVSRIRTL
jgi:hypothetical protein